MQGVVLAAGAGQRLRPVSLTRSKATVPICGRALIEHVLDSLRAAGITDFVIVVREPDDDVTRCCRVWAGGSTVRFCVQAERRGMAHALLQALPLLTGPCVLSACDSIVEDEFVRRLLAHHAEREALATLALKRVVDREAIRRTAVVAQRGGWITSIVEKPAPDEAPSDMGSLPLYVLEPALFDLLPEVEPSPRGELELQDALTLLIQRQGRVTGLETQRRWQVTDAADLLALNRAFLAAGHTRREPRAACVMPVHVAVGAEIGEGARIGPEAVLEAGCTIGAGAVVRRAVVLSGAEVPPGALVEDRVVTPAAPDCKHL